MCIWFALLVMYMTFYLRFICVPVPISPRILSITFTNSHLLLCSNKWCIFLTRLAEILSHFINTLAIQVKWLPFIWLHITWSKKKKMERRKKREKTKWIELSIWHCRCPLMIHFTLNESRERMKRRKSMDKSFVLELNYLRTEKERWLRLILLLCQQIAVRYKL